MGLANALITLHAAIQKHRSIGGTAASPAHILIHGLAKNSSDAANNMVEARLRLMFWRKVRLIHEKSLRAKASA